MFIHETASLAEFFSAHFVCICRHGFVLVARYDVKPYPAARPFKADEIETRGKLYLNNLANNNANLSDHVVASRCNTWTDLSSSGVYLHGKVK